MAKFQLTDNQIEDFHKDGYLIVPDLFSNAEISKLYSVAFEDDVISKNRYNMADKDGKNSEPSLWFTPGDDIYGLLTRSERIVHDVDDLLDDTSPVCHFHSNFLHRSDANTAETSSRSLISCYNWQSNPASNLESPSCIIPVEIVCDETILNSIASGLAADGDFFYIETYKNLKYDKK